MLIYEKKVDGTRHLFGNLEGNIPQDTDAQLRYVDHDGSIETVVANDTYLDDGNGGIIRTSDGKPVNVQIQDKDGNYQTVIGEVVAKKFKKIKVTTKPTKLTYAVNDTFDTTGMVVKATSEDGDQEIIAAADYTVSPANGAVLSEASAALEVTVTYAGTVPTTATLTDKFNIVVE